MGIETLPVMPDRSANILQLPRYMGIETIAYVAVDNLEIILQLPRYMGIETLESTSPCTMIALQLPRYMGIETLPY